MLPRHRRKTEKTQQKWTDKLIDGGLGNKQLLFRIPCGCPIRGRDVPDSAIKILPPIFPPYNSLQILSPPCPFSELSRLRVPASHCVTMPCHAMHLNQRDRDRPRDMSSTCARPDGEPDDGGPGRRLLVARCWFDAMNSNPPL